MSSSNGRVYAGQSADEREAERRARLLEATRELIGGDGYAATTVERICSQAGVSTRHFYLLYPNREAAFIDLYDTMTGESFGRLVSSLQGTEGRPLAERVSAAFMAYLRPTLEDLRAARITFVEVMGVSAALESKRLEYRESLIALVELEGTAAVARGEIADRDFRFAALALIGAASAIVYDWAVRPDRTPVAAIEEQLADLAVDLLTG